MKIKRMKRMTKNELVKHIIDNHEIQNIQLTREGLTEHFQLELELPLNFEMNYMEVSDDLITIQVEEEITEETEFKSMVEVTTDGLLDVWGNANISAWKDVHSKEFHAYIDGEFKCIWRNGKLVE